MRAPFPDTADAEALPLGRVRHAASAGHDLAHALGIDGSAGRARSGHFALGASNVSEATGRRARYVPNVRRVRMERAHVTPGDRRAWVDEFQAGTRRVAVLRVPRVGPVAARRGRGRRTNTSSTSRGRRTSQIVGRTPVRQHTSPCYRLCVLPVFSDTRGAHTLGCASPRSAPRRARTATAGAPPRRRRAQVCAPNTPPPAFSFLIKVIVSHFSSGGGEETRGRRACFSAVRRSTSPTTPSAAGSRGGGGFFERPSRSR